MMNQDKYLPLKQGLCIYNATILKYAINIDGQLVDIKNIANSLIRQLNAIQQDFTIPVALLERHIAIRPSRDLHDLLHLTMKDLEKKEAHVYSVEQLRELIYSKPNFKDVGDTLDGQIKLDSDDEFANTKQVIAKIMVLIEEFIERLRSGIEISSSGSHTELLVDLLLAIKIVNLLHTADWYFEYINDNWGK